MDRIAIEEAADFLLHLRLQRRRVRALPPEIAPRSIDDGYAVQDALHTRAGWQLPVLKVGATSAVAQGALGVDHPIAGRVPAEGVVADGARLPRAFLGGTALLECEFAFRIGVDGAVDAVAPAIEIADPRFTDLAIVSGPALVADNSAACAVVLGAPVPIGTAGDLTTVSVELRAAGEPVASGGVASLIDGTDGSLAWVSDHERSRGRDVAVGTWVITGTCTGMTPAEIGCDYRADFGPLGSVGFRIE